MTIQEDIHKRIATGQAGKVWSPTDFGDLGTRASVDKALQRMQSAGLLRRVARGLYDLPEVNEITQEPASTDYRAIIESLARREGLRLLVDGLTAANELGFTDAVPAKVIVHTETWRSPIVLDRLRIEFRRTAPSRLYWAGRPGGRLVQALRWLKDTLPGDRDRILARCAWLMADASHGVALIEDLRQGWAHVPAWMQKLLAPLVAMPGPLVRTPVRPLHAPEPRQANF